MNLKKFFSSKLFDRSMGFNPDSPDFNARLKKMTLDFMSRETEGLPQEVTKELDQMVKSWKAG